MLVLQDGCIHSVSRIPREDYVLSDVLSSLSSIATATVLAPQGLPPVASYLQVTPPRRPGQQRGFRYINVISTSATDPRLVVILLHQSASSQTAIMSTASTLGLRPSLALTIPLVSSSLTVFYAVVEPTIFYSFLHSAKTDVAATSKVVRLWWTAFLPPGLALIFSTTLPSIVGGAYALRYFQQGGLKWNLCVAGVTLALGHFAFVPSIADRIKNICDEEVEKRGKTLDFVKQWLKIHLWRTLLTDLPALVCFSWVAFGQQE